LKILRNKPIFLPPLLPLKGVGLSVQQDTVKVYQNEQNNQAIFPAVSSRVSSRD